MPCRHVDEPQLVGCNGVCTLCLNKLHPNADQVATMVACRNANTVVQCRGRIDPVAEYCPQCFAERDTFTCMSGGRVQELCALFGAQWAEKIAKVRDMVAHYSSKKVQGIPLSAMVTTTVIVGLLQNANTHPRPSSLIAYVASKFFERTRLYLPDNYPDLVSRAAGGRMAELNAELIKFVRSVHRMLHGDNAVSANSHRDKIQQRLDQCSVEESRLGTGPGQYHVVTSKYTCVSVEGIDGMRDDQFVALLVAKQALKPNKVVRGTIAGEPAEHVANVRAIRPRDQGDAPAPAAPVNDAVARARRAEAVRLGGERARARAAERGAAVAVGAAEPNDAELDE
jgi:hypothetical protein